MKRRKMKNSVITLLMGGFLALMGVTSCGDDDEKVIEPEVPAASDTYGKSTVKFICTCNPVLTEVADVTMTVKYLLNSQTFKLGRKGRVSYYYGTSVVPAEYHVTFDVKYKEGYVPEPGKTYDLEMAYAFEMNMYDKEGNPMKGASSIDGGWNLVNLEGIEAGNLESVFTDYLSTQFPVTYDFSITKSSNGAYTMSYPMP